MTSSDRWLMVLSVLGACGLMWQITQAQEPGEASGLIAMYVVCVVIGIVMIVLLSPKE